jgi:N-acetylglucosaminyldiphosphoundecaprenol N-acetyl-beta-D-mannosaminyltransferase
LSRSYRSTYLDWRDEFWRSATEHGWRVFLLGATQAVNAEAMLRLSAKWPRISFSGHHGYFNQAHGSSDNLALLRRINAFRPDVLLVGMGMPLQEAWIEQNFASLDSGVMLSVGAAFDYEAGAQKPAPPIYSDFCLEWLFRLAHDPRRLFRRYIVEPWALFAPAITDLTQRPFPAPVSMHRGSQKTGRVTIGARSALINKLQRVA